MLGADDFAGDFAVAVDDVGFGDRGAVVVLDFSHSGIGYGYETDLLVQEELFVGGMVVVDAYAQDHAVARGDVLLEVVEGGGFSTQGGHQLAQKFRTTTLPWRSERRVGLPERSSGKSSAVSRRWRLRPGGSLGRAKATITAATMARAAQFTSFRPVVIECYTNLSPLDRKRSPAASTMPIQPDGLKDCVTNSKAPRLPADTVLGLTPGRASPAPRG